MTVASSDEQELLRALARAKALFQLKTLELVLGHEPQKSKPDQKNADDDRPQR